MENLTPFRLSTLGHPQRLAVFRLLVRRHPDPVPAGEIAEALDLRPSTLSSYLAALVRTGLVTQARSGTSLRYGLDMAELQAMFGFLLLDCCRGRPEVCAPLALADPAGKVPMPDHKRNVLFICTGNSARSIFAETILRETAGDRFNAWSAGTRPYSELNPFALEVLKAAGHDISGLRAKHISEFMGPDAPRMDFVFTVCDRAANEECPAWDGQPVTGHWGMPDPVRAGGTDAEKGLAFRQVYGALARRISAFAALSVETLGRRALQDAVDDIARYKTKEQP